MGLYTEIGVVSRRDADPDAIINEIRASGDRRHTRLLADPPTDAGAKPDLVFGGVGWDWRTLLRNRRWTCGCIEQTCAARSTAPGGMDSSGRPAHRGVPRREPGYVLAKGPHGPRGTTAVLELEGSAPYAFGGRRERPAATDRTTGGPDRAAAWTGGVHPARGRQVRSRAGHGAGRRRPGPGQRVLDAHPATTL